MCDICVMNAVKDRMLSRRDLFRGAGAAGIAGAAASVAGVARAANHGSVYDLTHTLSEEFPTFFGEPGFAMTQKFAFESDGLNLFELTINEHTGTHVDAPLHFSENGQSVDQIDVGNLHVPLCVVDIREKAASDPDAQVTPEDLTAWIEVNGDIPDRACVAMLSGWSEKVETDAFRGADAEGLMHFPGFHPDAAAMLLEQSSASSIGVDSLSLDHGPSTDFATHYAWLSAGRYGIECLAGLENMPLAGGTLIVGAPKHRGGSGGPARIFGIG